MEKAIGQWRLKTIAQLIRDQVEDLAFVFRIHFFRGTNGYAIWIRYSNSLFLRNEWLNDFRLKTED